MICLRHAFLVFLHGTLEGRLLTRAHPSTSGAFPGHHYDYDNPVSPFFFPSCIVLPSWPLTCLQLSGMLAGLITTLELAWQGGKLAVLTCLAPWDVSLTHSLSHFTHTTHTHR
ncbi:hypothetical protein QBC36DRAFT_4933 [Triangularia setosa]|uniref:Secreted protein n=1 Tax=Triangularia setosa TaxID=2587417 RepID=A0AAN7A811_9PEZI|nr:hypothetical protein QBC36DRAFT_4933 [Podospora setosa]